MAYVRRKLSSLWVTAPLVALFLIACGVLTLRLITYPVNVGAFDLKFSDTGVAYGWIGLNNLRDPRLTHRSVPGLTGRAQEISIESPAVDTASIVTTPKLLEGKTSNPLVLSFWYRRVGPNPNPMAADVRIGLKEEFSTLVPLPYTDDWTYAELVVKPAPQDDVLRFQVEPGALLQVDEVGLRELTSVDSILSHGGVGTNDPQHAVKATIASSIQFLPAPGEGQNITPTIMPTHGTPSTGWLDTTFKTSALHFVTAKEVMVPFLQSNLGWCLAALIPAVLLTASSTVLSSLTFGLAQGFVFMEPAPAELAWVLWIITGLLSASVTWSRLRRYPVLLGGVATFVVANAISLAAGDSGLSGLVYGMVTVYCVLLFLSTVSYTGQRNPLRWMKTGMIVAALINALFGIIAALGFEPWNSLIVAYGRLFGFFKDPNVLSPFLVGALLLLQEEEWRPCNRASLVMWVLAQVVLGSGVLLTQSRAAIGALIISLIIFAVIRGSKTPEGRRILRHILVLTGVLTLLLVGFARFSMVQNERITFLMDYDLRDRFPVQIAGIKAGIENPLGIGPGAFEDRFKYAAHSLYVRVLAENGWLGICALLVLIGYTTRKLWQRIHSHSSVPIYLAWWVGVLLNSVVIDPIHWRHFWIYLGLSWALIAALDEPKPKEPLHDKREVLKEGFLPKVEPTVD